MKALCICFPIQFHAGPARPVRQSCRLDFLRIFGQAAFTLPAKSRWVSMAAVGVQAAAIRGGKQLASEISKWFGRMTARVRPQSCAAAPTRTRPPESVRVGLTNGISTVEHCHVLVPASWWQSYWSPPANRLARRNSYHHFAARKALFRTA